MVLDALVVQWVGWRHLNEGGLPTTVWPAMEPSVVVSEMLAVSTWSVQQLRVCCRAATIDSSSN